MTVTALRINLCRNISYSTLKLSVCWNKAGCGQFRTSRHSPHYTVTSVLFTGKHRSSCECSCVCAINKQACCGYTAHRCDNAYTWQDLPLASFSNKWKTLVILSQISGGIQLHKSHKQWQMFQRKLQGTNLLQNTFFCSFYNRFFLLPLSILDCLTLDCWHDHKTLDKRHRGMVHVLLGVRTKKGPFVRGRHNVLNFLVIRLCCWMLFRWGRHVIMF